MLIFYLARFKQAALPLFCALALSSCASVGPDYSVPKDTLPTNWQNTQTNPAERIDLSLWWKNFNDPYLDTLIDTALAENLNLQSAQSKLRQARAQQGVTAAQSYPSIGSSATGRESRTKTDDYRDSNKTYAAGFDASWEIDIFGGVRRANEAASANTEAVAADLNHVKVSLVAEVATQYFNLQNYRTQLETAQSNLKSRQETLQLVTWKQQAGLSNMLEVLQMQSSVAQIQASIPTLNQNIESTKQSLAILLGKTSADLEPLLPKKVFISKANPNLVLDIPANVLRQRPDIRATERRLAMQTAKVGVATADLYPKFNLSGSFGVSALSTSGLFNADTIVSSLLGSITAPIFEGGRIRQNINVQNELQTQALLDYQASLLQGIADVETAVSAYQKIKDRAAQLNLATKIAKEATFLAQIQYRAGSVDLLNVLETQRTQFSTEEQSNIAQANISLTVVQLYKALGGGWQEATVGETNE